MQEAYLQGSEVCKCCSRKTVYDINRSCRKCSWCPSAVHGDEPGKRWVSGEDIKAKVFTRTDARAGAALMCSKCVNSRRENRWIRTREKITLTKTRNKMPGMDMGWRQSTRLYPCEKCSKFTRNVCYVSALAVFYCDDCIGKLTPDCRSELFE